MVQYLPRSLVALIYILDTQKLLYMFPTKVTFLLQFCILNIGINLKIVIHELVFDN